MLVHLSGGEDLTLYEIELLMQRLQKFVPEDAHVLFGAAIDPAMGDSLSITLISALPEDSLAMPAHEAAKNEAPQAPVLPFIPEPEPAMPVATPAPEPVIEPAAPELISDLTSSSEPEPEPEPTAAADERPFAEQEPEQTEVEIEEPSPIAYSATFTFKNSAEPVESDSEAEAPVSEDGDSPADSLEEEDVLRLTPAAVDRKVPRALTAPWGRSGATSPSQEMPEDIEDFESETPPTPEALAANSESEPPKLKLGVKPGGPQSELSLDSAPRGRFEGESPNVFEGEDLDLPPFLRKRK